MWSAVENSMFLLDEKGNTSPKLANNLLISACKDGDIEKVRLLLTLPYIDPTKFNNKALRKAVKYGNIEIVKLLLAIPRVDPNAEFGEPLLNTIPCFQIDMALLLLADKRINPTINNNGFLREAAKNNWGEIVTKLLSDPRVYRKNDSHSVMNWAVKEGYIELVQFLLDNGHNESLADNHASLELAIITGDYEILRLLLTYPAFHSTICGKSILTWLIQKPINIYWRSEIIKLLLANLPHQLSFDINLAIQMLSVGHDSRELVELVLNSSQIDLLAEYQPIVLKHYQNSIRLKITFDFETLFTTLSTLKRNAIASDIICDFICKNQQDADALGKALISFQSLGINNTLIDSMCSHNNAKEILSLVNRLSIAFSRLNKAGISNTTIIAIFCNNTNFARTDLTEFFVGLHEKGLLTDAVVQLIATHINITSLILDYGKLLDKINLVFIVAVQQGGTEIVQLFLNKLAVLPRCINPIQMAVNSGHLEVVNLLLSDSRFNPMPQYKEALINSSTLYVKDSVPYFKQILPVLHLLKDAELVDENICHFIYNAPEVAFTLATNFITLHQRGILKPLIVMTLKNEKFTDVLLKDLSKPLTSTCSSILAFCVEKKYDSLVKELLDDTYLDLHVDYFEAVKLAFVHNPYILGLLLSDSRIIELLLNDPRLDFFTVNQAIYTASKNNRIDLIKKIVEAQSIAKIQYESYGLRIAACRGYVEITKILLANPRLNHPEVYYAAMRDAAINGHIQIVQLLLSSSKLDKSNELIIEFAAIKGHSRVVTLLLADPRFNPAIEYVETLLSQYQEAVDANQTYDFEKLFNAFFLLKKAGIDNEITCNAIFKETQHAELLAKAFISFRKSGCLTNTLMPKIIQHAEYALEIAAIFAYLKPTGLLDCASYADTIFELSFYAKDIKQILELMKKANLLGFIDYDIELVQRLNSNALHKNKIILSIETVALIHFDQDGQDKVIFDSSELKERLEAIGLAYLLTKKLKTYEVESMKDTLNIEDLDKLYDIVKSANFSLSCDDTRLNLDFICKEVVHVESISPVIKLLESAGLLSQSNFVALFKNTDKINSLEKIFTHLNWFKKLTKKNCDHIFSQVKYADNIATALESLRIADMYFYGAFIPICNNGEYAQTIVALLSCLKETNIYLLIDYNFNLIDKHAKYSISLLSAFTVLMEADSLNQANIDLIFANPKQAIFIAANLCENRITLGQNSGLDEFVCLHKSAKIMTAMQRFWAKDNPGNEIPDEIITNIVTLTSDNCLDCETRDDIIFTVMKYF